MLRRHTLNISFAGTEPPKEFRIFTAGQVVTSKGTFVFDAAAAIAVMAEYAKQGNELMIDYDHASLASITLDPALAGKAAGWFTPEVRNGELWAVNVRWTLPAEAALRAKEWRYMSPAFETTEDGHVTSLMNVAITNLPATRNLQPLMAVGKKAKLSMDPDQVKAALEALVAGDDAKCAEILKGMIAAAAGGDAPAPDAPALDEKPAPDAPVATSDDAPPSSSDPAKKKDDPAAVAASLAKLFRLSGKMSIVATVADVEVWRESHVELAAGRAANAKEKAILEGDERRRGCVDLVTKANRAPATVWATSDKGAAPKAYLLSMPIDDFRAYVADQIKACAQPKTPKAPAGGTTGVVVERPAVAASRAFDVDGEAVTLDARELAICAESKCDPQLFATLKARSTKKKA